MIISNLAVSFILSDLIDARLRASGTVFTSVPSPEDVSAVVESLIRWAGASGFISDDKLDLTGVTVK